MPDSIPTETPVGKIPAFFIGLLGPDYKTTLSGYAASAGAVMLGIAPLTTGRTQQILSLIGILMTGGGIQQMGQHSRDKAPTQSER